MFGRRNPPPGAISTIPPRRATLAPVGGAGSRPRPPRHRRQRSKGIESSRRSTSPAGGAGGGAEEVRAGLRGSTRCARAPRSVPARLPQGRGGTRRPPPPRRRNLSTLPVPRSSPAPPARTRSPDGTKAPLAPADSQQSVAARRARIAPPSESSSPPPDSTGLADRAHLRVPGQNDHRPRGPSQQSTAAAPAVPATTAGRIAAPQGGHSPHRLAPGPRQRAGFPAQGDC